MRSGARARKTCLVGAIKKGRMAIGGAVGLVYCFGQIGWAIAELTG